MGYAGILHFPPRLLHAVKKSNFAFFFSIRVCYKLPGQKPTQKVSLTDLAYRTPPFWGLTVLVEHKPPKLNFSRGIFTLTTKHSPRTGNNKVKTSLTSLR